ncbi:MAG: hypothetical protein ACFFD4_00615 [Candidatus Odinarchaeota archaeon]
MSTIATSEQSEIIMRISRFLNLTITTLGMLVVAMLAFYVTFLDHTVQNFIPVMTAGTIFVLSWVFKTRIESPDVKNHKVIFLQWFVVSLVIIALMFIVVIVYPVS